MKSDYLDTVLLDLIANLSNKFLLEVKLSINF
jgi:hypothetical protein